MPYTRRIVHFSPGPTDFVSVISDRAIAGCWFEMHRQGGCGAGELRLKDEFPQRNAIDVGDWIAFEFDTGDRWYLGRVEHRQAESPAGVTLRLEGLGVELGEAFPGGFNPNVGDGTPPHRYANTDLFSNDPDRDLETFDSVDEPHELVDLLLLQYVVPQTHITRDPALIEASIPVSTVTSLKFRGEESVRSIIKELAVRARNASWGVDADGKFFFLRQPAGVIATFQEGVDVVSLQEMRDRNLLYNRIVLTGGYVYDQRISSGDIPRRVYRWRGNYQQPASRDKYGERRILLWVPWIRTRDDSRAFTREFFRTYADPPTRFLVEVANLQALPRPWDGPVRLLARDGSELALMVIETVRIQFDHAPRLKMEVGPEDPLVLWPEPTHEERWEIPDDESQYGGDWITLTDSLSSLSSGSSSVVSSSSSSSTPGTSSN